MKKGKAITLLSVVCALLAVLLAMTFVRFSVGVKDYNSIIGAIELGYDMEGGTAYTVSLAKDNKEDVEDIDKVLNTLGSRLDALGYDCYSLTALKDVKSGSKDYAIKVETKKTDTFSADMEAVFAYGKVEFYGGSSSNPATKIMDKENAVAKCYYVSGDSTTHYAAIEFTDYGYNALKEAMDAESGTFYFKIALGDKTILNSSLDSNGIQNKTVYASSSAKADAERIVLQISTGGLAYKYDLEKAVSYDVPAAFGENTALYSLVAVVSLVVCAIVFFAVKYKGYGLIATLSLLFFILVETAMLIAVPGITLNFGGVVGILAATVLAADGLIIIIKRIDEEYALGKTVKAAVSTGYKRSLFPVLGTNLFAGVAALALLFLTKGYVRVFAITFGIGAVISFFTAMLIARMFTSLILPLTKNPDNFLNLKRAGK